MNKPIKAARDKGIDVAMWNTKNGGHSFTFRKTYKDKATGEYKESKQFFPEELGILKRLIEEAISWQKPEVKTEFGEEEFFNMVDNVESKY